MSARAGGLIPAHAGKTQSGAPTLSRTRAHPRSRGENSDTVTKSRGCRGSSPLTRGKPIERFQDVFQDGLIPAHAGKTNLGLDVCEESTAHPRSRGENTWASSGRGRAVGSSPLTRGKHMGVKRARARGGLIPAHAGKTSSRERAIFSTWAHPRSRGENTARLRGPF